MKLSYPPLLICAVLLLVPAARANANYFPLIGHKPDKKAETPAPAPVVLNCPKCKGTMEEGYFLDIQGSADNLKGPTLWVQGPVQKSWFSGVVLKKRERLQVRAYRCTSCGYLELYAQ